MENTKITRISIRLALLFGFSIPALIGFTLYKAYNNPQLKGYIESAKKMYELKGKIDSARQDFEGLGIKKSYRGQFTWQIDLPLSYVESLRSNMLTLISSATVKKVLINNKDWGYEVVTFQPNSLFAKIELSIGDQLTHLNRVAIGSIEAASIISDTILTAKTAQLKFIRSGKELTYNLNVIDDKK